MLAVTAALSVSERIKDAGAYAGLASILGLAVLSLLYFGQARELKRLREWAGRAPERTAELQEQANAAAAAAAQAPRRPAAQPAAAAGVTRVPAQVPATAAGRPGAAATAAGAVAAAAPPAGSTAAPAAPGVTATPVPAAGAAATAAPGTAAPAAPGTAPAAPGAAPATPGGAPAPPNGTPAPAGQETQAIPAVTPDAPGTPTPPAVPATPASVGPPTDDKPVPLRQGIPAAPRPRPGAVPVITPPDHRTRNRALTIGGGLVGLVLVVGLLGVLLLGGGDDTKTSARQATATSSTELVQPTASTATPATPAIDPASVKVFVLNATSQNGLAREVSKALETDGYGTQGTATAAVNNIATTTIYYRDGKKRAASAVAKELKVSAANLEVADPEVTVQASPGSDVIVQLGADKADQAGQATP